MANSRMVSNRRAFSPGYKLPFAQPLADAARLRRSLPFGNVAGFPPKAAEKAVADKKTAIVEIEWIPRLRSRPSSGFHSFK
jgi:hypothetical protein